MSRHATEVPIAGDSVIRIYRITADAEDLKAIESLEKELKRK
jgi:hypothetical protein